MEPTRAQLLREARTAMQAGRYAQALAAIDRALEAQPADAGLLTEKASVLRAGGEPEKARDIAQSALRSAPTSARAHAQLGLAFLDLRRPGNAEASFQKALGFDRSDADALAGFSRLRLQQKRLAEAEQMGLEAVRARPGNSQLFTLLGDIFAARSNYAGMLEAYQRARDLDPMNSQAAEKYVAAKEQVGGLDAARAALEEAVARMPNVPQVHAALGKFLSKHGMLSEAAASLRRALALDPAATNAIQFLVETKRFASAADPDAVLVSQAYSLTPPGTGERATAAFALAKVSDDIHDYDRAFDAYLEGNAIVRRRMEFSLERERRAFDAIAAAFTPELLDRLNGKGNSSAAPIFILGMPRSGTTLTETILSRHTSVKAAGELENIRVAATGVGGASPVYEARPFAERLKPRVLQQIGETYLDHLPYEARRAPHFTDKMPHNFRMLGLIRLVFPNARIVHTRRDPLDNCLSMFKANFGADALAFTFDLVELGRYYNLYRKLMAHWRRVLPGGFFEIDYEALVGDPETTTRALFDYCGLDWSPAVLEIGESRREVLTMSFAQVRQPINTGSVSAAARYGSHLDPLRAALAEWDDHQP